MSKTVKKTSKKPTKHKPVTIQAVRCPVCSGRGLVPSEFYNAFSASGSTSIFLLPTLCRSCSGKGYLTFENGIV